MPTNILGTDLQAGSSLGQQPQTPLGQSPQGPGTLSSTQDQGQAQLGNITQLQQLLQQLLQQMQQGGNAGASGPNPFNGVK